MPTRAENRADYNEEYREACEIADERASGRCEFCKAPEGLSVFRVYGTLDEHGNGDRLMFWKLADYKTSPWCNKSGDSIYSHNTSPPALYQRVTDPETGRTSIGMAVPKRVLVQIGHAHLNQNSRDHGSQNVKALCRYCHLSFDAPFHAVKARKTRQSKKDATRPLIALAEEGQDDFRSSEIDTGVASGRSGGAGG